MLNIKQFRDLIIKSTLNDLLFYSEELEELLIFTCAVESLGGTYLHQIGGPALGIYQMELATYNDIWQNYLKNKQDVMMRMFSNFHVTTIPSEERLIYDLRFATAMTAIHYKRTNKTFPYYKDENEIWEFYKLYYNTMRGAAEKEYSISKYKKFIQCN